MNDTTCEPPPPGYLLTELGYVDELEAAASLDLTEKTLSEYRKQGIGPEYTEIARRIFYSREARAKWLANGGTRAFQSNANLSASRPMPSGRSRTPASHRRQTANSKQENRK